MSSLVPLSPILPSASVSYYHSQPAHPQPFTYSIVPDYSSPYYALQFHIAPLFRLHDAGPSEYLLPLLRPRPQTQVRIIAVCLFHV